MTKLGVLMTRIVTLLSVLTKFYSAWKRDRGAILCNSFHTVGLDKCKTLRDVVQAWGTMLQEAFITEYEAPDSLGLRPSSDGQSQCI